MGTYRTCRRGGAVPVPAGTGSIGRSREQFQPLSRSLGLLTEEKEVQKREENGKWNERSRYLMIGKISET